MGVGESTGKGQVHACNGKKEQKVKVIRGESKRGWYWPLGLQQLYTENTLSA